MIMSDKCFLCHEMRNRSSSRTWQCPVSHDGRHEYKEGKAFLIKCISCKKDARVCRCADEMFARWDAIRGEDEKRIDNRKKDDIMRGKFEPYTENGKRTKPFVEPDMSEIDDKIRAAEKVLDALRKERNVLFSERTKDMVLTPTGPQGSMGLQPTGPCGSYTGPEEPPRPPRRPYSASHAPSGASGAVGPTEEERRQKPTSGTGIWG